MSTLIIVESPAKARTISKFLGGSYVVKASMGHVRDLPKSKIGVDLANNFEPTYDISKDKVKVIAELKADSKKADKIILATDEDREGEAIAWHLAEALGLNKDKGRGIKDKSKTVQRIAFHEITKPAIEEALKNPREIDTHLVDAQQARRVLDRFVGYELSPLLWKKVRYGLSAGRVQSVAVRLIVDREREIQAFVPTEYWSLTAKLETPRGDSFFAELSKIDGEKAIVSDSETAHRIESEVSNAQFSVQKVEKKSLRRSPAPPFTTSTLQQEAARKLGFSVSKTMMLAQRLYDGSYGEGLITYMRTDSVNLATSAVSSARAVITSKFGAKFVSPEVRKFITKSKGAQEAHEAIRPVDPSRTPEMLARDLEFDALRLYELIWKRTLACQMADAELEQTGADIVAASRYTFRATGQVVRFPGFFQIYTEGRDEDDTTDDDEKRLPEINEGELTKLLGLVPEQHFTKPPARYTEASLVKKLETEGIGRPSTYAPTITTVIKRGYVEKEAKALKPTDTGFVVNDFLVEHFTKIVDYKFTAKMEEELDEIAEGKLPWQKVMGEFYEPFHALIVEKEGIEKAAVTATPTDIKCEKCNAPMQIKLGRFGKFLSCSRYPECKAMKPLPVELGGKPEPVIDDAMKELAKKICPLCNSPLEVKRGRFGPFVGCTKYPECKHIEKVVRSTGITCDVCGKGTFNERTQRKTGKKFYGCSNYPACRRIVNIDPRETPPSEQPQKESKWKGKKSPAKDTTETATKKVTKAKTATKPKAKPKKKS